MLPGGRVPLEKTGFCLPPDRGVRCRLAGPSAGLSARALFHDDTAYVIENPLVQDPSWGSVKRFFGEVGKPSTVRGYYQPLTMVSLMLDRFLSGPYESRRRITAPVWHCTWRTRP